MENLDVIKTFVPNRSTGVMKLIGSLTAMDAIGFKKRSLEEMNHWPESVRLDLLEVSKVDLTGINSLIKLNLEFVRSGKQLWINLKKDNPFHKLFQITKLDSFLNIEYSI